MSFQRTGIAIAVSLVSHAAILSVAGLFLDEPGEVPPPSVLNVSLSDASSLKARADVPPSSGESHSPAAEPGVSPGEEAASSSPESSASSDAGESPSALLKSAEAVALRSAGSAGAAASRVGELRGSVAGISAAAPAVESRPEPMVPIEPEYPRAARRMGLGGTVVLDIRVGPDGRASGCRIIEPRTHRLLEEAAAAAAMDARYRPGTKNDVPVEDVVRLKVFFRLECIEE